MITLEALKYWLDMLLGSFHDLTCTVTCQQDTAHHSPMSFSAVGSSSGLMMSTETWFLHFSTEQTEAVCSCLPRLFLFWFWERGWGPREGSQLRTLNSNSHSQPTGLHFCVVSFLGCIFQAIFLWQHFKKFWGFIVFGFVVLVTKRNGVSLLFFSLNYGCWVGLLLPLDLSLSCQSLLSKKYG